MQNDENHQILSLLMAAQEVGEAVVLATITQARGSVPRHVGTKMLIYEHGRTAGTIGGGEMESRVITAAHTCLQEKKATTITYQLIEPQRGDPGVCGGEVDIFLEPYLPPATVLIIGCGHVGQAVAELAHWLGYRVAVTDDRAELVTPDVIANADLYLPGTIEDVLRQITITANTAIILVTRNVAIDRQILPHLTNVPASYIGVMGSKRRWQHTRQLLQQEAGLTEAQIAKFHTPIGLELNAETPKEIAISILAELIMLNRGGTGERMMAQ